MKCTIAGCSKDSLPDMIYCQSHAVEMGCIVPSKTSFPSGVDCIAREIDVRVYTVSGGYELVRIPGGTFLMGSPEREEGHLDWEGPQHEVTLESFYLGKHPVTNEEYGRFLKATGHQEPRYWADRQFNQPKQPVVGVSWEDAQAYCEWAGLRLPTEAQWEYACRAGTTTRYWSGDTEEDLARVGWYWENSFGHTHPVGEKPANPFGLFDTHGNVWEWCQDWYEGYEHPVRAGYGLRESSGGSNRVSRGGSWFLEAQYARSAYCDWGEPLLRCTDIGFRPAKVL